MRLHQKNLWTVTSHEGSSLDQFDAVGGLTAGAICLPPEFYSKAKGIRVWTTKNPDAPESHSSHNAFTSSIGGKHIQTSNGATIVEFDTTQSTDGTRGIYKIDGAFEYEHLWNEPLTKAEALKFITPHGLDEYNWNGSKEVTASNSVDMTELLTYSTDITQGVTTLNGGLLIALPAVAVNRGLITTVVVKGTFAGNGPHDFRLEARDADGSTVLQSIPRYNLTNDVTSVAATFPLYTNGVDDDLSTTGYKLAFVNDSQSAFTLKAVKIIVQSVSNPDFSQA